MTFLFDEQMSPRLVRALQILGQPVQHVQDAIGKGAPDDAALKYAAKWDTFSFRSIGR